MWECGLKREDIVTPCGHCASLPMWECGLKPQEDDNKDVLF